MYTLDVQTVLAEHHHRISERRRVRERTGSADIGRPRNDRTRARENWRWR